MRSKAGLELIKRFEGLSLNAYLCPAGIPTVGYGATGRGITLNTKWTKEQAETALALEVAECEDSVLKAVSVDLNDNELSALVSLVYNIGIGAFRSSTLLKLLQTGDKAKAADQFLRWNKARGRVLEGLTKRREEERALFLS